MVDNAVGYKVVFGGDDGSEHIRYPGRVQNDQILQRHVAAIGVARKVQYDAQVMHELQRSVDGILGYTALYVYLMMNWVVRSVTH